MKARPDLKMIVFSGYAIDGPARKILDAGAEDFIQKPFSLTTLSEKLKEVLEGQTSLSGCNRVILCCLAGNWTFKMVQVLMCLSNWKFFLLND